MAGLTLALLVPPAARAQEHSGLDPRIEAIVGSISEARLRETLTTLVGFGTRNTLSDTTSSMRGIGAAREWIRRELAAASPRLTVAFDVHLIPPGGRVTREVELRNVVAILPGRSPRRVYVSGHYDTLNLGQAGQAGLNTAAPAGAPRPTTPRPPPDPNVDAPGANDDGSGTALVIELARAFGQSGVDFDATLVFITVAGEEQGLLGSRAHARRVKAAGLPVEAMFNNDIVGGAGGPDGIADSAMIRLYSEGPEDSPSRALARFTRQVAAQYVPSHTVRLMARRDRFNRGGDHTSWNLEGYPAVGFRESRENYSKQHSARDTLDGVSFPYLAQNARVNAAAMAVIALAPPAPVVVNERGAPLLDRGASGYDARLRWQPSPGAAAYRIHWRDAWGQDWQHDLLVGTRTEYTFPRANIDDVVYGVSAIDAQGHESPVSAYVMPPPNY